MLAYLVGKPYWDESGDVIIQPAIGSTNSRRWMPDFGIVSSLGSNLDVRYIWHIQEAPSNTLKLMVNSLANASAGVARINPAWVAANAGFNFDTLSLTDEGVQSITWSSGDAEDMKGTKIVLDAVTAPTSGQYLVARIRFETASWTLAQNSFWSLHLIDE